MQRSFGPVTTNRGGISAPFENTSLARIGLKIDDVDQQAFLHTIFAPSSVASWQKSEVQIAAPFWSGKDPVIQEEKLSRDALLIQQQQQLIQQQQQQLIQLQQQQLQILQKQQRMAFEKRQEDEKKLQDEQIHQNNIWMQHENQVAPKDRKPFQSSVLNGNSTPFFPRGTVSSPFQGCPDLKGIGIMVDDFKHQSFLHAVFAPEKETRGMLDEIQKTSLWIGKGPVFDDDSLFAYSSSKEDLSGNSSSSNTENGDDAGSDEGSGTNTVSPNNGNAHEIGSAYGNDYFSNFSCYNNEDVNNNDVYDNERWRNISNSDTQQNEPKPKPTPSQRRRMRRLRQLEWRHLSRVLEDDDDASSKPRKTSSSNDANVKPVAFDEGKTKNSLNNSGTSHCSNSLPQLNSMMTSMSLSPVLPATSSFPVLTSQAAPISQDKEDGQYMSSSQRRKMRRLRRMHVLDIVKIIED